MADAPKGHIVLFAYNLYGHQKPLCALAAKIVRALPVYITYLAPSPLYSKILDELKRHFLPGEELRNLIRVVSLEADHFPLDFDRIEESFATAYKLLAAGSPIPKTDDDDETFDGIPAPTLAIVDVFAWKPLNVIRSVSGTSVKIFVWHSGGAVHTLTWHQPTEKGGLLGDLDEQLLEAEKKGSSKEEVDEIAFKLYTRSIGRVLKLPGLPEIYDWENFPQNPFVKMSVTSLVRYSYKLFNQCDGVILQSSPYVEAEAIDAWKEWYGSRPVVSIAPLSQPVGDTEKALYRKFSPGFSKVEKFLDDAVEKYGEHSIIYISFGSAHWSAEPEKIWAFLDTLLELGVPFIFAHASQVAVIPDDVRKKLDESELVFHSTWLPQQVILQHKATAWFVTHCGQNSVLESLIEGVPLIAWPFVADQPHNAASLTKLGVAYELFEVRTGRGGLRPSLRYGKAPVGTLEAVRQETILTVAKAMGPDGRAKRKTAEKIGLQLKQTWSPEGGIGWGEVKKLVSYLA